MRKSSEPLFQMTLRLPISLYDKVVELSDERGLNITEFIKRAISEKIEREEGEGDYMEKRMENLEKEIESLKKFIEAFSVE